MGSECILVVRLSSMGDIIHALPAVASLKHSFPERALWWLVARRWIELLEGNPFVDRLLALEPGLGGYWKLWQQLRTARFALAVDLQGLIRSALLASLSRPERLYGFHESEVREKAAAVFYSSKVRTRATHVVERNLELVAAAGASNVLRVFPVPAGRPEAELPRGPYVLASPLAGWPGKQWPLECYGELARALRRRWRIPLVLCGPPEARALLSTVEGAEVAVTGIAGLIDATRRAAAVVGVDSGPLHLAAALGKRGVAIYGPTDPARNGPYGGSFVVLRSPEAVTTYKRRRVISAAMRQVTPEMVLQALSPALSGGEADPVD